MEFEPVVGIEIHSELATESKVFCGCAQKFGERPNSLVCPVCMGLPGALPVLNKKALELSLRTAIALHCEIPQFTVFDRKNYYYPDLPKNYQISQNYNQLGKNGYIDIDIGGTKKRIRINNVHLEEDAGKLLHPEEADDYSLVDLNRSASTLLETVTEPDIRSLEEADVFMNTFKNLLQYLEVCSCKMQEGVLRFEVNISVRPAGDKNFGTKVEIKNLNSTKIALKCIEYEVRRQSRAINSGEKIVQETRLWDEVEMCTKPMRSKEFAEDYRYFPEPDLAQVNISEEWKDEIKANLPELQDAKKERFIKEYAVPQYDAKILTSSKALADYFESAVKELNSPKAISNWIMTEVLRELNERETEPDEFVVTPQRLAALISMIEKGTISGKIAKEVFIDIIETGKSPEEIVKEKGLLQISDADELSKLVDEAIAESPDAIAQYKKGRDKALGFIVGQVMKKTRGKANPGMVNKLLRERIEIIRQD